MTSNSGLKEAALIEYLDECSEMLERFSKNLALIESATSNVDTLAAIYRDMHTIKGSSQLFGFAQVGQVAHAMETCLDPVRKGQMRASPALVDILYAGSDIITTLLAGIRENKNEPDLRQKISALIPRLVEIAEIAVTGSTPVTPDKSPSSASVVMPIGKELIINQSTTTAIANANKPTAVALPIKNSGVVTAGKKFDDSSGFGLFEDNPVPAMDVAASVPVPAIGVNYSTAPKALAKEAKIESSGVSTMPLDSATKSSPEDNQVETIRVHVSLLDNLMNLVGELVLIRNQLLQHTKVNDNDSEFGKMSQRLNVLTAELQNEVMKTRMQPVGNVLNKFTRVVRDMGRELGKKVELNIHGAETELDKTIIEAVKDPLTHIVRNSVDHGVESGSERKAAGKSETGHIEIKAHHESGQVIIEISDDGRGLDRNRIGRIAVEKSLITNEALAKMTDREVQFMIFAPGFSTAATLSNISGRGVGMDVVKTNVERIGGMVDLTSVPGKGTTIKLKIPLTLAIVPALIVKALDQKFAIPQSKLVELVMIDRSDSSGQNIEYLQGSPVLRLRGKILSLLNLSEILTKPALKSLSTQPNIDKHAPTNIVILNADNFQFGLVVDAIEDTADIVVKALSSFLKDLPHFSGATIMGDGSVALTIDVIGISASARAAVEVDHLLSIGSGSSQKSRSKHQMDSVEYLFIDVGAPGSYAIPLTVVSRLEEFDNDDFELSGEQKVIRYRDSLLPIFSLPKFLHLPFESRVIEKTKTPVVVIRRGDFLYGIEVEQIQDVVALSSQIDQTVRDRPGILGTMVAGERVLVVVDILGMIDAVKTKLAIEVGAVIPHPGAQGERTDAFTEKRRDHRILVAEDSSFFRSYIKQVLTESGFKVETASDGADAWTTLENATPGHYSLILSDIEMPVMDGLELATKISADTRFKHLPLVAITTRYSTADKESGKQAGFNLYLEKLNPERLIAALDELLSHNVNGKELKHAGSQ
jgi:two-component system chemotaxis sensor kinase CheA